MSALLNVLGSTVYDEYVGDVYIVLLSVFCSPWFILRKICQPLVLECFYAVVPEHYLYLYNEETILRTVDSYILKNLTILQQKFKK